MCVARNVNSLQMTKRELGLSSFLPSYASVNLVIQTQNPPNKIVGGGFRLLNLHLHIHIN